MTGAPMAARCADAVAVPVPETRTTAAGSAATAETRSSARDPPLAARAVRDCARRHSIRGAARGAACARSRRPPLAASRRRCCSRLAPRRHAPPQPPAQPAHGAAGGTPSTRRRDRRATRADASRRCSPQSSRRARRGQPRTGHRVDRARAAARPEQTPRSGSSAASSRLHGNTAQAETMARKAFARGRRAAVLRTRPAPNTEPRARADGRPQRRFAKYYGRERSSRRIPSSTVLCATPCATAWRTRCRSAPARRSSPRSRCSCARPRRRSP